MTMTHIVKHEISHTTMVDKWMGTGDKWHMYKNVSKQLHTKKGNNHRIVTHNFIISMKKYQHLYSNLDYHMKADFTIIG